MSEVTVLGIFVADLSFSANKIPTTGETILGDKYNIGPGGKGCNQAIALARLGCNINFISKIGDTQDMVQNALSLLENEEKHRTFKKQAQHYAEKFNLETIVNQYETIYADAIASIH